MSARQKHEEAENESGRQMGTTDEADWTWADPKGLKVRPEFQRLIPLQSKGELLALEQSIEAEAAGTP
jgi:hypothetical protein